MERPVDGYALQEEGDDILLALVEDIAKVLEHGHGQRDALHGLVDVRVEDAGRVEEALSPIDDQIADLFEQHNQAGGLTVVVGVGPQQADDVHEGLQQDLRFAKVRLLDGRKVLLQRQNEQGDVSGFGQH